MTGSWSPIGTRELRIGLIGLGSMGRNHLRVLGGMPGVRLAAIADPDGPALAAAAAGSDAQAFAEPTAMLAEADLDAVVIASPTTSHLRLVLAAIERGMAVLVEKPLAATPAEADRIVAAASTPGAPPVQVGHIERFNPGHPRARPTARGRLAVNGLCDIEPPSRTLPRPDPRRRSDGGSRHARRRHPVCDRW